jgi:hypothetical protein
MQVLTNAFLKENTRNALEGYTKDGFLKVNSLCCGYYEYCEIDNFFIKLHAYSSDCFEISVTNHKNGYRKFYDFTTIKNARLHFINIIKKYFNNVSSVNFLKIKKGGA